MKIKNKRFYNFLLAMLVLALAWTQNVCAQSTTSGTKISLSGNTGTLLASEDAGGTTYSGYWRHYQAPIQLVMTNVADGTTSDVDGTTTRFHGINAETGIFTTLPNNMTVETDKCLAIYNYSGHFDCSYFAIIVPKGYHILRYVIDADVTYNSNTDDVDFREFHLASDATAIDDDDYAYQITANGSSTTIDRVLDYSSSRLYFKVTFGSTSAHSFKFTKFYVYYTIDEPFAASVPNIIDGEVTSKFGSGLIDLGTFSNNSKSVWSFTSSNATALSEADIYDVSTHTSLGTTQLSGSPYYFTATNGDYMVEAPAKFRIVGANINFLNISTDGEFDGYEPGSQATSVVSGNKYLIKNADGKYISYINGALTYTDDARTAWTVTSDGSGYTISIGGESDSDSGSSTTTVAYAQNSTTTVFDNPASSSNYYRIPAIVKTADGNLLALSDLRIGGSGDVGSNAISLVAKKSTDNGASWGTESTIIAGNGSGFDYAHGDAAVVADSETGKIILLAASGTTGYSSGGVQLGQYYSTDNGATWSGSEITSAIKTACSNAGINLQKQFFTSGRIIQSSKIKVGDNYRIYSAMCTGNGSVVMYSDDFGANWSVLGSKVAYSGGDETVLEELPNGDLLLSARLSGSGRGFNVFNYSDLTTGAGSWNTSTATGLSTAANCNGEMLLVPTSDSNVSVLLHSVALSGRTNVTVYYKLLNKNATSYTSPSFYSTGWTVLNQMSSTTSAYSTMVLDKSNNVAFLYEENLNGGYDIQFTSFKVNVTFPESSTPTDPNIPATKTYLVHSDDAISTSTTAEVWLNNSGDLYRVQTGTSSSTEMKTATSISSGTAYYISDGNGNYLNLSGSSIVSSTTPSTKWTFTKSGSGYTIKSGNYYLIHNNNSLSASTYNNNNTWTYSNGRLYYTSGGGKGQQSTTYYLTYNSGWILSTSSSTVKLEYEETTTTPTYSTDQTFIFFDVASTKTKESSDAKPYTVALYDQLGTTLGESKSVPVNSAQVTLSDNDFNNDAIKFNVANVVSGQKALFNVDLKLLPLDPHVDYVDISVAAGSDNSHIYSNRSYSSDFEFSNDGDPITITVSSDDYVKDNCYLLFQNAYNNNENTNDGGNGESNFFLMGSKFDMNTRGTGSAAEAYTYKSPLPSDDGSAYFTDHTYWDATELVGTELVELTNIKDVAAGNASTIQDTPFETIVQTANINYTYAGGLVPKVFTEDASNTLNVYMYACDIPLYNLTTTRHMAYKFYTVKVQLQGVNEEPVVEVTPIYTSTVKGKNNKNTSIAADADVDTDHKFVGVKVTSKWADASATGTPPGKLNSSKIIEAINTAMAEDGNYYTSDDTNRGILYVDMSELFSVTTAANDNNPWDTFNEGTADNCLYFMPNGFGRNVENTIEGGENGEALGNIIIKDKQPFFSPYNFKTGTFAAQYTREITGGTSDKTVSNSTLILPFDVTLDSEGKATDAKNADEDETITFCTLGDLGTKTDADGNVYTVAISPVTTGVASANTPYHVQSTNSQSDKSFAISLQGATIAATPTTHKTDEGATEFTSAHGSGWTGYGSYFGVGKAKTGAVTGAETFYFSKNKYYRSSQLTKYDTFYVLPFRAYFATTATIPSDAKTLSIVSDDDETTSIEGIEQNADESSDKVYTIQGIRVNKNDCNRRGIYIVNGKKIVKF